MFASIRRLTTNVSRPRSAPGQTRSSERFRYTSAQAPKAELQATQCNVAVVPTPEVEPLAGPSRLGPCPSQKGDGGHGDQPLR